MYLYIKQAKLVENWQLGDIVGEKFDGEVKISKFWKFDPLYDVTGMPGVRIQPNK